MTSSFLSQAEIPIDHSQKQILLHPSSPPTTIQWSPPSPSFTQPLLAVGHAQGLSIYKCKNEVDTSDTLDKAEAFRKRYFTPHSIVLGADCFEGGRWSIFVMEL